VLSLLRSARPARDRTIGTPLCSLCSGTTWLQSSPHTQLPYTNRHAADAGCLLASTWAALSISDSCTLLRIPAYFPEGAARDQLWAAMRVS